MEYLNSPSLVGQGTLSQRVAARMASPDWHPGIQGSGGSGIVQGREPAVGLAVSRLSQCVDQAQVTAATLLERLQPLLTPQPPSTNGAGGNAPRAAKSDVANAIESLADRVIEIERTLDAALSRLEV
jgi:hypothetical protein